MAIIWFMQTCCWKGDYSRLSSVVFNYKVFFFLSKGCSSCVQKLIVYLQLVSCRWKLENFRVLKYVGSTSEASSFPLSMTIPVPLCKK